MLKNLATTHTAVGANKGIPAAELMESWVAEGVNVSSLSVAYRVRDHVAAKLAGKPADYQLIADYLRNIDSLNPGSKTHFEVDASTSRFKRAFVSIGSVADMAGCALLRVVQIDGAHMRGRQYNGTAFVNEGVDANGNNVTLAIGLGPIEDTDNWTAFLTFCRECGFGDWLNQPDVAILSDRHKGIPGGLEAGFPDAHHANCLRHIIGNMSGLGAFDKNAVWDWQKAISGRDSDAKLDSIGSQNERAGEYLRNIDPKTIVVGCLSVGVSFYGHRTSNRVESKNSSIREDRSEDPLGFIDKALTHTHTRTCTHVHVHTHSLSHPAHAAPSLSMQCAHTHAHAHTHTHTGPLQADVETE